MDPKQTAQLDPKLKEAYDRVMGTPTNLTTDPSQVPTQTTASAPATTSPATLPTPELTQPVTNTIPVPATSTTPDPTTSVATTSAAPTPPPVVMPHSTETVKIGGDGPAPATPVVAQAAPQKKKGIPPLLIVVGAIVFLIVYSLFWVKFLNIPIPFLSQ